MLNQQLPRILMYLITGRGQLEDVDKSDPTAIFQVTKQTFHTYVCNSNATPAHRRSSFYFKMQFGPNGTPYVHRWALTDSIPPLPDRSHITLVNRSKIVASPERIHNACKWHKHSMYRCILRDCRRRLRSKTTRLSNDRRPFGVSHRLWISMFSPSPINTNQNIKDAK